MSEKSKKSKKNRAEIFLAFDALKGFKEYINAKNQVIINKKELSEDTLDELNWKVNLIQVGKMIKIIFFDKDKYIEIEGMVSLIDRENRKVVRIVDKEIKLSDIVSITGEGIEDCLQ